MRTFVRSGSTMRRELVTIGLALAIAGIATFAFEHPFDPTIHRWEAALAVTLGALALAWLSLLGIARSRRERFASLAGLGGVVIAVAFLGAELLVGPPQRVLAAPGQTYRPPNSARLAVVFPAIGPGDLTAGRSPTSVDVETAGRAEPLAIGQQLRAHSYVLRCDAWPAAYVRAWSSKHIAQTVTQPTGVAFVSPVLQFPIADQDGMLTDTFAIPALHRDVRVKYYPGLPARGIDIPFLQLQIDEENGGSLFDGVAVAGRPMRRGGTELLFDLGAYPVVSIAGAPDRLVYTVGAVIILIGCVGTLVAMALMPRMQR